MSCSHQSITSKNILKNPFDMQLAKVSALPSQKCKSIPEALYDVPGIKFYKDSSNLVNGHSSIIDTEKLKIRNELVKPISDYLLLIDEYADGIDLNSENKTNFASCFQQALVTWAQKKAILGSATNQGYYERNWFLAGVSLVYLRMKSKINFDYAKQVEIEDWFFQMAVLVKKEFSKKNESIGRNNNHLYWASLGVLATSIAIQNGELFNWTIEKTKFATTQVNAEGFLPLELYRLQRALHYHSFALQPLMMISFLTKKNGYNFLAENNAALDRLAKTTLRSYHDNSQIKKITGYDQEITEVRVRSWIEIYNYLSSNSVQNIDIQSVRPATEKWLGGDLTLMFSQLSH